MSRERTSYRLADGGLIDRSAPVSFTFDGVGFSGLRGDTLASALLANGVGLVGRSFKYHRPRGILTAGPEEPNALVDLRTGGRREPNTRATTIELFNGLVANSQNRWPSLDFDLLAVNGLFAPFFAAGFYYKTFMWPAQLWEKLYEPVIRRAAGLGMAPTLPDPDTYERATAYCDVLVIGGGAAGLAAALAAGRSGARVILAETDFALGGRLLSDVGVIDGLPALDWVVRAESELAAMPDVTVMRRTVVFGAYDGGTYGALERVNDHVAVPPQHQPRQRYWKIVARRAVLASGAIERPIVFAGNDRPGVMMAASVRSYVARFAVAPGRRVAVFTNNDDGWRTVAALLARGIRIAAIIDSRADAPRVHHATAAAAGALVFSGVVAEAHGGARGLRSISVALHGGGTQVVPVDCLAMSGGWNPNIGLACHHGGRPRWLEEIAAFVPGNMPPGMTAAGAANGSFTLGGALQDGHSAAEAALAGLGLPRAAAKVPLAARESAAMTPLWLVAGKAKSKAFVDFQNDVTAADIALAHQEGYVSVEHMKRYTTLGMATDQGKTGNVTGLAILAAVAGRDIPEVGITTHRPPAEPVAIGAIAGHHRGRDLRATRLPPTHRWAREQGASFIESGVWLRVQWYPRAGETDWLESVNREVLAVRHAVGVCDVSTLGKIDVCGPDAGVFLDRVYANTFSTLAIGRARYGLMLREDGLVMDDGTTSRLAAQHYLMTTTTANAAKVMQHLEFARQVLWPKFDVQLASVSDQWAQLSIAGPRSLDVLERLVDRHHDISSPALPHLGVKAVTAGGGISARLFRISYSGERAYEIAVPARYGDALMRAVMAAGASFGITPYGVEALNVLRIEKGHVAGNEINGTTTARDLGLGGLMSKRKDFIGRVLAEREGLVEANRWAIAGFKPVDTSARLRAGAHFVPVGMAATAANDQGYMTSVAFSPTLQSWIGLGLIARGRERHSERVRAVDPVRNGDVEVEIVNPVFLDPDGARMKA